MTHTTIELVTGLGAAVGSHFAACIRESADSLFHSIIVTECFVDANRIIPVLSENTKVARLLLKALGNHVPDLVLIPCNAVHVASSQISHVFGDRFIPIDEAVFAMIHREDRQGRFLILGTA
ncbi:MAG: hypothetical protein MN733_40010, partial [Nitrososphaera sp.]|nr:hypothetical protein [Nitrososphaera sp.]